ALRQFEADTGVLVNLIQVDQPVDNPDLIGKILSSDPQPGEEVAYGITVRVAVGVEAKDKGNGKGKGG
ncbi:MAG: hypothetical protein WB239_10690, partial [Acidimicrobiia bacterium]